MRRNNPHNQNHLSGTYILRYDATGLAPENYLYRLTTSDYSITKKNDFEVVPENWIVANNFLV